MAKKSKLSTLKAKSILILAISVLLCFSIFFCTACGKTEESSSNTTYSKTENDTAIVKNGSFEFGTYSLDLDDYPKNSSITGWGSVSADDAAPASKVSSGIINTKEAAWNELIDKLYTNNDFLNYAKDEFGITATEKDDVIAEIKTNFINPGVHSGAKGSKVLMVNNYTTRYDIDLGTAQKSTSSTTVTLEKGEYGKISVWVYTADLVSLSGEQGGANVRLVNSLNSNSQANYGIYGIDTNETWQEYTIYVKGDANYKTTLQVVVGLGIGNGANHSEDWTQGTAFFDDVVFETIDETAYNAGINGITAKTLNYNSKDVSYENGASAYTFAYDMTLQNPVNYFSQVDLSTAQGSVTTSTSGIEGVFADSQYSISSQNANLITVDVTKASYTVKIESAKFSVAPEKYAYVSFKLNNNLARLDRNGVTVYAYNDDNVTNTLKDTKVGEETVYGIMFKNNNTTETKTFYLEVVVGPTDVSNRLPADYATGTVTISDMQIAYGDSYQYIKDTNGKNTDDQTDNYDYYSLYSSGAVSSITLGEDTTDNSVDNFSFTPSASSFGNIMTMPTNVNGYVGISSDSIYIKAANTNDVIDNRSGAGDANGNYAGLINTKYLESKYNFAAKAEVVSALNGLYNNDENKGDIKNIQPLMIYNASADAYGYIGNKTLTVAASSFAKISLKVKVIGDAKAYIYLVNAYGEDKNVLKMDSFVANTDGYNYVTGGTAYNDNDLALVIDNSMMNGEDWLTVSFYVATGATEKKFRLEMWNGGRDGSAETKSQGIVFFDNVSTTTSGGFTEYTTAEGNRWEDTFTDSNSVLAGVNASTAVLHKRELDETEKQYNKDNPNSAVAYDAKYVWVKSDNLIYAVFNTVDPVAVDPYETTKDDEAGSGCAAQTDPSTFWLSFSSIVLGVALVLAIVMLIVKNVRRKRKANASDAKSHYKVTSRVSSKKNDKKAKPVKVVKPIEEKKEDVEPEVKPAEQTEIENEEKTETLDDYVYGDVQDFGEEETNNDGEN